MANVNTAAPPDSVQAEVGGPKTEATPPQPSSPALHGGSKVYKSGTLFLSSKGIGWTSWKKRWFILTQTSLVFYRSDPNVAPQKGAEANLTLGGIDLNSSGSVVVKEDKKLITVSFTDGRDGRAFTLKAETMEDLLEWKAALEEALANAPSATTGTGQNGVTKTDQPNEDDASSEQSHKQAVKSMVLGRPILLALEDIDGTPSFLEKALRFIEEHGVKTEGILRQAADVEHVERRIQEFEKGKTDFSPDEDAHVIGDCIKFVLRELPSSPVPASCCKALVEAYRTDRSIRLNAMRTAICETFPEPNRRLLQRILNMMEVVASNKSVNRMSVPAVAACMAPLLLRPLLAGECDIDHDVNVGGDSSALLLQAAAAANHAQAIVITLLEEYDNIFGDGAQSNEPYTDSEESGSESEEITDDESYEEEDEEYEDEDEDEDEEEEEGEEEYEEEEEEEEGSDYDDGEDGHESSSSTNEIDKNLHSKKDSESRSSECASSRVDNSHESNKRVSRKPQAKHGVEGNDNVSNSDRDKIKSNNSESLGDDPSETSLIQASSELSRVTGRSGRRPTVWGRAPGRKNLSMESIDVDLEEEVEDQKLDHARIPDVATLKSLLQECIHSRKHGLHERRTNLEQDVSILQEQLQKERNMRTALGAGLRKSQPLSVSSLIDEKTKEELDEIAQLETDVTNLKKKADDLEIQLNKQRGQISMVGIDLRSDQLKSKAERKDGRGVYLSSTPGSIPGNKETSLDKSKSVHRKLDSPSLQRSLPQNQQTEGSSNLKNIASYARAFTPDSGANKPMGSVSRKSSTKEGSNTSALSKLTNRLNFLKERRTQIANELQSLDKGRHTSHSSESLEHGTGSESSQSTENLDKHQESKGQSSEKRTGT